MPVQSSLSQAAHKGKIPATGSSAPELQRSNRKTSVQEDPGITKAFVNDKRNGDSSSEKHGMKENRDEDEEEEEEEEDEESKEDESGSEDDNEKTVWISRYAAHKEGGKGTRKVTKKPGKRTLTKASSSSPAAKRLATTGSKRGRMTNSFKLAKEHLKVLENADADDLEYIKKSIAGVLWNEKFPDVVNALENIDHVYESKVTPRDKRMSSVAVKENLHKPYINSSYQDAMKEIQLQTEERTRLVEAHAQAIRELDLKISFLVVHGDKLRQNSSIHQELKNIYQNHINVIKGFMGSKEIDLSSLKSPHKR